MSWINYSGLRFFVAIFLIAIILLNSDRSRIWQEFGHINLFICGTMVMVNLCLVGLFAKRWAMVCADLGIRAPFLCYFKAIWASHFAGQLGPTLVMAEGARYAMIRCYGGRWPTIASQIVDRGSGQVVLFGMILALN